MQQLKNMAEMYEIFPISDELRSYLTEKMKRDFKGMLLVWWESVNGNSPDFINKSTKKIEAHESGA